ncbi:MAG: 30S ribosomal protein S9 [Planctomycetota bacterium]|nr:30S ribosomal protein S9 [Planctomycetota bacterium]MDI6788474.1 30S ribosomal protein S9 [Planctomycetota bacterium]
MTEPLFYRGTGRRKTAVAEVVLKKGTGKIVVNNIDYDKYFLVPDERLAVLTPLQHLKLIGRYDISADVSGGGKHGQAEAVRLGLARALKLAHSQSATQLSKSGLLTRDGRMKERKKYGQKGARKRFQYSKR